MIVIVFLTGGTAYANPLQTCSNGHGSEAIEACTALIESRRYTGIMLSEIYNNRGVVHSQLGDREKAIEDYTTATKLPVKNARPFRNMAIELVRLERFDEALEKIAEAIKIEPSNVLNYGLRAEIFERANNLEEAIKSYTELINREKTATNYHARGVIYAKLSRFEEALADYSRAIQLYPRNPSYYFARGLAWADAGKCDQAIPDYTKAIELSPKFSNAYNNRGVCHGRLGKRDESIADYEAALKHEPSNLRAKHNLATARAASVVTPIAPQPLIPPQPPLPDFKEILKLPEMKIPQKLP